MARHSKMVSAQLAWSEVLSTALAEHLERVSGELSGVLPGCASVSAEAVRQRYADLTGLLQQAHDELERAEDAYIAELSDDPTWRDERDAALARVVDALRRAHLALEGLCDDEHVGALGFGEDLPRTQEDVVERAERVIERMSEHQVVEGVFGQDVTLKPFVDTIRQPTEELSEALGKIATESAELERASEERAAARERWRAVYTYVAQTVCADLSVIGDDETARALRPTARRAAGLDAPET